MTLPPDFVMNFDSKYKQQFLDLMKKKEENKDQLMNIRLEDFEINTAKPRQTPLFAPSPTPTFPLPTHRSDLIMGGDDPWSSKGYSVWETPKGTLDPVIDFLRTHVNTKQETQEVEPEFKGNTPFMFVHPKKLSEDCLAELGKELSCLTSKLNSGDFDGNFEEFYNRLNGIIKKHEHQERVVEMEADDIIEYINNAEFYYPLRSLKRAIEKLEEQELHFSVFRTSFNIKTIISSSCDRFALL